MSVISPTLKASLTAKKEALEALLVKAYDSYESAIEQRSKSYRFDSGEGAQSETFKSLDELYITIERLERQIDALDRRINGRLIFDINCRRKFGTRRGGRIGY